MTRPVFPDGPCEVETHLVEDARMWVDDQNPGSSPTRFLAVVGNDPDTSKISFGD